ncbi:hypothetical protein LIER_21043 [Lithospermum erythrorhizon]|uniref:Uncharacterized protein n=1 Tax=Lithospermum erythrorhizon TaxID=34254 RepID=A0AAV3QR82_LITER
MEVMASLWGYQESVDEIRQKLLCTTIEFEQFKAETSEELIKRNEDVCQLIQLLKDVSQERDKAKDQLQKLVNKVLPSSADPTEFISSIPLIQNENPVFLKSTKGGNLSIIETNSLTEVAVNYNSHGSPPVDSFFDAVSSHDLPNINMADSNNNVGFLPHQPMLMQDSNLKVSMQMPNVDHATLIMDNLIKGKPLPPKGKFLKAVLDVPPLLHSLLLAGPLPKWRNPPQLQTFQIPPFSVQTDAEVVQQKRVTNLSYGGLPTSQNYNQISCGSSQMSTTPMFNFAPSGSCLGASNLGYTGANVNNFDSLAKRQRLQ